MASDVENHFTVFIRLPFNRGSFIDPPPVAWSAAKERDLWEIISRQSRGNEIDWKRLAHQFEVTQSFLLQQAAWLYERQLSQVRAQMRRMGNRQSATASPAPNSTTASVVAAQGVRRGGSISSRAPSRLSTQNVSSTALAGEAVVPSTPVKSRASLPARSSSTMINAQNKGSAQSRPLSRKSSRDNDQHSRTNSRGGSVTNQFARSPVDLEPPEQSSSDDEVLTSKTGYHRSHPAASHRRAPSIRKSQHIRQQSIGHVDEETEDDDSPGFLPFAAEADNTRGDNSINNQQHQDPSATLRGGLQHQPISNRPALNRHSTSERIRNSTTTSAMKAALKDQMPQSLNSSASSNDGLQPPPPRPSTAHIQNARRSQAQNTSRTSPGLPTPLSPTQQAALARAAGLSPRSPHRRPIHTHTGSESSPSMGSSFSDLDDASVTQSALEEALMSGMGSVATTLGGIAGGGGGGGGNNNGGTGALAGVGALGSRMSGISQALRSRYFDARSGPGGGGDGSNNGGPTRGESER